MLPTFLKRLKPKRYIDHLWQLYYSFRPIGESQRVDKVLAVYANTFGHIDFIKETLLLFKKAGVEIHVYSLKKELVDERIEYLDTSVKELKRKSKYLEYPIFLSSYSWFPVNNVWKGSLKIHMFHSLVSIHDVYHENAISYFDIICCAGPHHNIELMYWMKRFKRKQFTLNTGYIRVDRYASLKPVLDKNNPTILFAPSWHEKGILKLYGEKILNELLPTYKVVLRPHPATFYKDKEFIGRLTKIFSDDPNFILDKGDDASKTMMSSDVMISDYSGVAMEFALAQCRPVIFINSPRKALYPNWKEIYAKEGVQVTERPKMGYLVENADDILNVVNIAIREKDLWIDKLEKLRPELVYNFGNSAETSFKQIFQLLNGNRDELELINKDIE